VDASSRANLVGSVRPGRLVPWRFTSSANPPIGPSWRSIRVHRVPRRHIPSDSGRREPVDARIASHVNLRGTKRPAAPPARRAGGWNHRGPIPL